jgi:hypothetical protein
MYGIRPSVLCSDGCGDRINFTRLLVYHGWMLTPPMLRQEASA